MLAGLIAAFNKRGEPGTAGSLAAWVRISTGNNAAMSDLSVSDLPTPPHRRDVLLGLAAVPVAFVSARAARKYSGLELVATFTVPRQVTGVAVSPTNRIFVNFPRWEEDVSISVAEVGPGGRLTPYPNSAWNAFRNADPKAALPQQSFVCVQSVTVDPRGRLWVLDAAAPGLTFIVPGGPKLVCINLATNEVERVYHFGTDVAPQGSYLNDIRFTPDGRRAVITNSGSPGSLVVLDIASGAARNVLSGDPSTQFDPNLVITVSGQQLRMLDGQPAHFSADGLIVDATGQYAIWQATTGHTIYRAPIAALFDASLTEVQLASRVQVVAQSFVTDGYWLSRRGQFLLTSPEDYSVKRMMPDGTFRIEVQDKRLFWPDSMAEGPDGSIYVTASHIPEMKTWQGPGIKQTELFRFKPR